MRWVELGRVGSGRVHVFVLLMGQVELGPIILQCPEMYNGLFANCELVPKWVGSGRWIQFLMGRVGLGQRIWTHVGPSAALDPLIQYRPLLWPMPSLSG